MKSKYCIVEGCFNGSGGSIFLHSFPNKEKYKERYQVWIDALTKDKTKPFNLSSRYSRICSAHFVESSFVKTSTGKSLTTDAVPTIFPWGEFQSPTLFLPQSHLNVKKKPLPKMKMPPSICGNCRCSLKEEDSTIPQKCVVKYSGVKDDNDLDLYVNDAIAYIYGISWSGFCTELQNTKESMFNIDLVEDENGKRRVAFCRQCASYLYLNYTAHKNFERLSKSGSVVKQAKLFKENNKHNRPEGGEDLFNFEDPFQSGEEPVEMKWNANSFILPSESNGWAASNGIKVTPCTLTLSEKNSLKKAAENYTCVHCCETFISKDGWLAHSLNHTEKSGILDIDNPDPTTCTICGKVCKSHIYLKYRHKPSHKKDKRWKCRICAKKMVSKRLLNNHLATVHKGKIKVREAKKCEVCRAPVLARGEKIMEAHLNAHAAAGVFYECTMCYAKLRTSRELRKHRDTHKEKEPMFCKFCGRPFYFKAWLISHEKKHGTQKMFQCDLCPKKFHDKYRIRAHKLTKHNEDKIICKICGKCLKNKFSFKVHNRVHTDAEEGKVFKCDECGKILKHTMSLNNHKLRVHNRITRYPCSICGQILSGPKMLQHHENLHKTDPNFKGRPRKLKNPNKTYIVKPKSKPGHSNIDEKEETSMKPLGSESPPQSKELSPPPPPPVEKPTFKRRFLNPSN